MINKTHLFAKNIPFGAIVSIYGEDWICKGPILIYDGDFEIERIELDSIHESTNLRTFVHPTHQFSLYNDKFSDCEEIPF